MTPPLVCLLAFVAWTCLLLLALLVWRSALALRGERGLDEFPAGVPHGPPAYWRLNRAHLNCVENLPLFASVVLTAAVAGVDTPRMDALAGAYVACRGAQSFTHLASGAPSAVLVRATFYGAQVLLLVAMLASILGWL